jgi:hypothetical protein
MMRGTALLLVKINLYNANEHLVIHFGLELAKMTQTRKKNKPTEPCILS